MRKITKIDNVNPEPNEIDLLTLPRDQIAEPGNVLADLVRQGTQRCKPSSSTAWASVQNAKSSTNSDGACH